MEEVVKTFVLFCVGAKWPLNYHLVYDVCAALALLVIGCTFFLPKSIEKKRKTCPSATELKLDTNNDRI